VPRQKRVFTSEYRAEAVALVLAGDRPIAVIARDLGIGESTLGNWVAAAKQNVSAVERPLDVNERAELKRLREELRVAKMDRDFLKKAAAFFASQHT
jgi:transposase